MVRHGKKTKSASRKSRRSRRGSRRQRGGDSASYTLGAAVAPEAPYAQTIIPTSACEAVNPPGQIANPSFPGGLPGLSGGAANSAAIAAAIEANMKGGKRRRKGSRRHQRGGRYTVDVGAGPINGIGSAGPSAGMAVITRIGCEGGLVNTSPPGAAPNPVPLQSGGVGGVDSAAYQAPTAGQGNQPSQWVGSTGSPSLLQIPQDARAMNPACLKTGGRRKASRKTRRGRKGSRTRKH